jgi:phytoene desaturase
LFESIEAGSAEKLRKFLSEAKYKYETGMENLVYKPGISLSEFADPKLISGVFRLQVFSSFSRHVRKYFTNPRLIALMEFPVLFLGAMPEETPALYSLMNYAGLALGTWYPMGGFGKVIDAMSTVAVNHGATFHLNAPVDQIRVHQKRASHLLVNGENIAVDAVIGAADYHHIESRLLPDAYRNYPESYWNKKTFAPSCLIYYLGINKRIKNIKHHTLFFDADFRQHAINIYKDPKWPQNPSFYVCCPSQTDPYIAPPGHENLFLLMPIAPGLKDSPELREQYFHIMMDRLENQVGEKLISHIDYNRSYCVHDFISDYNAYQGNAYGLANTLMQTAHLKPKIINKKLPNLFYAGQLTVPGPGVPPSIISGKIAATQAIHHLKEHTNEVHI